MIKKTIGAVLLVLILFVFVGCNDNPIFTTEGTTETPTTNTPTTETPTTEVSTTVETTTDEPTTEEPTTEVPTTEAPTTEAPFATELFFSEYGEGSGYNKYLEIFNGTGESIDLSDYSIQLYSNGPSTPPNDGKTSPSASITLTGILDNFDVFVIANPTAEILILEQADIEDSQVINFNGNDPVTLSKNGIIIDSISMPGDATDFGTNKTLVRKDSVTGPNSIYDSNEWLDYGGDTFTYLGEHSNFSPTDTVLLEQDVNQLPDAIDVYGDYTLGSGSNGSVYTILNVTGEASDFVTYSDNYIISSVDEDVVYEGQLEVEIKLDGVGTTTKLIDLFLKFTTLDVRTHPEYYESITDGISGETLLIALNTLINDTYSGVDYGAARDILAESDADPNNPDNLILVYLQSSIDSTWDSGVTWNREHVWPQSYLGDTADNNTVNIASDLHNLKPANPTENGSRGNRYFDYISVPNSSYEPHDDVKGDIARILLYMVVMYEELSLVDDGNLIQTDSLNMGLLFVLLEWHELDPVDDFELNRNNVIYSYQGNRNPFIDNPEYVSLIWEDDATS